jgi:hypothetical protein
MPLPNALARVGALAALAAVAAAAVVLWPSERPDAPTPLDVGDGPPRPAADGGGRTPAVPAERALPAKEGFATAEEAVLLASALDKIDLGLGPPLPPGPEGAKLEWDRALPAMLSQPGLYVRWEDETLKAEVLKMPFQFTLAEHPAGAPKEGLLPWGPLFAELMHNGFMVRVENPVVWIGRQKK